MSTVNGRFSDLNLALTTVHLPDEKQIALMNAQGEAGQMSAYALDASRLHRLTLMDTDDQQQVIYDSRGFLSARKLLKQSSEVTYYSAIGELVLTASAAGYQLATQSQWLSFQELTTQFLNLNGALERQNWLIATQSDHWRLASKFKPHQLWLDSIDAPDETLTLDELDLIMIKPHTTNAMRQKYNQILVNLTGDKTPAMLEQLLAILSQTAVRTEIMVMLNVTPTNQEATAACRIILDQANLAYRLLTLDSERLLNQTFQNSRLFIQSGSKLPIRLLKGVLEVGVPAIQVLSNEVQTSQQLAPILLVQPNEWLTCAAHVERLLTDLNAWNQQHELLMQAAADIDRQTRQRWQKLILMNED
ncbi:hypothetical protein [Latilactobacillus curvatus]|nr:hypothetical protein [Latilactobacillus curvatus]ASN61731.1 hypothetical protein CGZ47_03920 [Latilactobacillus curvatus]MCT2879856.1 hypothetical protein [Latilactobacillus curvatus]